MPPCPPAPPPPSPPPPQPHRHPPCRRREEGGGQGSSSSNSTAATAAAAATARTEPRLRRRHPARYVWGEALFGGKLGEKCLLRISNLEMDMDLTHFWCKKIVVVSIYRNFRKVSFVCSHVVEFHTPYIPQNLRLLEKKTAGCNPPPLFPPENKLSNTHINFPYHRHGGKQQGKARLMAQSEEMFLTPAGGPKSCVNNLRSPPLHTTFHPPPIPHWEEEEEVDSLVNWFWGGKSKLLSVKDESGENTQFSVKNFCQIAFS